MIAHLDGIVAEVRGSSLIIQTGAFGLEVFAPKSTLMVCRKGETIRLHTFLVVKETELSLYAFHQEDMLTIFKHLITVSGVGPKLALATLSSLPTTLIATAIFNEDIGLLTSVSGLGKKTAAKMILDLKNKLPEELMASTISNRPKSVLSGEAQDAAEALITLGYRENRIKSVVAHLALENPDESAEGLIRKALAKLR